MKVFNCNISLIEMAEDTDMEIYLIMFKMQQERNVKWMHYLL